MTDAESRFADSTQTAGVCRSQVGGLRSQPVAPASLSGSGAPSGRRALARFTVLVALFAAILAVDVAPASAIEHHYTISFKGSGANELSSPSSADVDNSSGASKNDVYVTDEGKQRVEKFDAAGSFISSFGIGELGTPRFLAVDSSSSPSAGNVYVADAGNNSVRKYTEGGTLITGWGASGVINGEGTCGKFSQIGGIDVDSAGNLLVWDPGSSRVCKYSQSGSFTANVGGGVCRGHSATGFGVAPSDHTFYKVNGAPSLQRFTETSGQCVEISSKEPVTGINVDSDGTVYATRGTEVNEYQFDGAGQPLKEDGTSCTSVLSEFGGGCPPTFSYGSGNITDGKGLGVSFTKTLYVADTANHEIDVFKATPVPLAETLDPTGNNEVHGNADPNGVGPITECYFEFGLDTKYGSKQNCAESVPFNVVQAVHANLPGLTGELTYHYRLVLGNGEPGILGKGKDKTITPHYVKGLKTEAATEITRTTAKLNGSFEGTNEPTTYFFEYGTTTGYGSRSPEAPTEKNAGTTNSLTPMNVSISGLKPDTEYHFRAVAKNPLGTSPGKDVTFKTPVAVQGVTTEGTDNVTRTSAVLHGSFTGNGESHTFYFEWGPTSAYGHVTGGPAGNGTGKVSVSEEIHGLEVQLPTSQPYHYRLVATNATGSTVGADKTFITEPPAEPTVSGESSEEITPTEATVKAMVNPGEGETVYLFEYGTDTSYGAATPVAGPVGNDNSNHPVSENLAGLTPGTTYHFRAVAINYGGTGHGADQTFTTPDVPRIDSSAVSSVTRTSAHLSMSVGANSSPTNVYFEYGTSGGYGTSTAPTFIGSSPLSVPAAADINGLAAGTTYHFRAVAVNGIGTSTGPDQTLTTLPPEEQHEGEKPKSCKKGFVKKHGKCVKKKPKHRKHHRHNGRNG